MKLVGDRNEMNDISYLKHSLQQEMDSTHHTVNLVYSVMIILHSSGANIEINIYLQALCIPYCNNSLKPLNCSPFHQDMSVESIDES